METLGWSGPPGDAILMAALDEELEQYRLLAYLQRVDADYRAHKLYPHLDELRARVAQLRMLRARSEELLRNLPGKSSAWTCGGANWCAPRRHEDELLRTIEASLTSQCPSCTRRWSVERDCAEELSGRVHCAPVGVLPLSTRKGYLLLRQGNEALGL